MYISMIGSPLYVTITRPDVMHAVCQVTRFQASPKDSHLLAVRLISYILRAQQSMVYGILKVIILICMLSLMLIMQVVLMIGRVLVEKHSILEDVW